MNHHYEPGGCKMNNMSINHIDNQRNQYVSGIKTLAQDISINRAVDNDFYKLWMKEKLTSRQLEIFAVNYFYRIVPTVSRLALAFASNEDLISRSQLIRNLSDELGHGDPQAAHIVILKRWLDSLLRKETGRGFDEVLADTPVLPATQKLTEKTLKLCSGPAPQVSGAILAQEWHAYTQLVNLYEGFRNYIGSYELEEFHDSSEYFYIHIGWAEKEHKEQSISIAVRSCHSDDDFNLLKHGFTEFLGSLAEFWDDLHANIRQVN